MTAVRTADRRRIGFLAAVAAMVIVPAGDTAHAITFEAALAPIRIAARPGQVVTTSYRLALAKDEPRTHFKIDVQDWWRSEDGSQSFYAPAGSLTHSCGRWVSLDPVEASASGGEALSVRLTISVPRELRPGGYWCALTVDEMPDPLSGPPDGVGVRFLASVSTAIYVNVDPIERGAEILAVDVKDNEIVARMRNTGNAPVVVEGRFEFFKPAGDRPVAVVDLARTTLLTEPVTTGVFASTLPDADKLPEGRYLVRLIVDIGLDHYIGIQREIDLRRGDAVP